MSSLSAIEKIRMTKKIFLDLEGTIIRNWNQAELINVYHLYDYLRRHAVKEISIFSFAIWDNEDKDHFEHQMKAKLEQALNVQIIEWLSVDEMLTCVGCDLNERTDFMRDRSKGRAFIDVCKAREHSGSTCVLIDDAVPYETLVSHVLNLELQLIPVDLITKL